MKSKTKAPKSPDDKPSNTIQSFLFADELACEDDSASKKSTRSVKRSSKLQDKSTSPSSVSTPAPSSSSPTAATTGDASTPDVLPSLESSASLLSSLEESSSSAPLSAEAAFAAAISEAAVTAESVVPASASDNSAGATTVTATATSAATAYSSCSYSSESAQDHALKSNLEESAPSLAPQRKRRVYSIPDVIPDPRTRKFTTVQVAINRALFKTYDYKVKGYHEDEILGSRVMIKFGRSVNTKEVGIVVGIGASADIPEEKIKEAELLDQNSLIYPDVFRTLQHAASYYHYPLGQTMVMGMPKLLREGEPATYKQIPGLRIKLDHVIVDPSMLQSAKARSKSSDGSSSNSADIRSEHELLLSCKIKIAQQRLRSKKQRDLLEFLSLGPRSSRQLREQGFSSAQEHSLIKAGLAERIDLAQAYPIFDLKKAAELSCQGPEDLILNSKPLPLNEEQEYCLNMINAQYDRPHTVFLLHGITGSGKTEVYLQAIEHCLREGKKALILVPEISLTPQTFRRFYERFKVPIATMHSTLSARERMDAFLDMQNQRAAILIGTRSALFTSIPDLGLIIVDEEHDSSFKQTDNLRYNARNLANFRAHTCGCKLILGSATPSLESVYHAEMGHYIHLDLLHRANNAALPKLMVVDLSKEPFSYDLSAGFSQTLCDAIGRETAKHRQALVFINRRGYSHSLICRKCRHVLMCPNCDKPLTVHHSIRLMCCHICNTTLPIPNHCPHCGSNELVEIGLGTEQVEAYLSCRYPDINVVRIDRDVITTKAELEMTLRCIRAHLYEILVGTQMVAKGHDFPDITVVGIVDVDTGLVSTDYHSLEYTAQLITQVAGRAGRAHEQGEVFIQTYFPNHPLILNIASPNFNYYNLALELLKIRKEQRLPPYYYQALLMTNSANRALAHDTLERLIHDIQARPELLHSIEIGDLEADRIERRFNRYHFHVSIMTYHQPSLHRLLDEITVLFSTYTNTRDLRLAIDVDPLFEA